MNTSSDLPDQAPGNISNHLGFSIAITIIAAFVSLCTCCGLGAIPGIVAIVFSAQVNGKLRNGDLLGARSASKTALILCWVTAGITVLCAAYLAWSVNQAGGISQFQETIQEAIEQAKQQH